MMRYEIYNIDTLDNTIDGVRGMEYWHVMKVLSMIEDYEYAAEYHIPNLRRGWNIGRKSYAEMFDLVFDGRVDILSLINIRVYVQIYGQIGLFGYHPLLLFQILSVGSSHVHYIVRMGCRFRSKE